MQLQRATEIMQSPENIEVTYKNSLVWIESVQGDTKTAYIRVMDTTQNMSVEIGDLVETGHKMNK